MARPKRDNKHIEQRRRIEKAKTDPGFQSQLTAFENGWKVRGRPNIWHDRHIVFEADRGLVFWGMYYELRHLCEHARLIWPDDGGWLWREIIFRDKGDNPEQANLPDEPPPPERWTLWRWAREGLGVIYLDEWEQTIYPALQNTPDQDKVGPLNRDSGLTYRQIGVWKRSILEKKLEIKPKSGPEIKPETNPAWRAVHACWKYINSHQADSDQIARLCGWRELDERGLNKFFLKMAEKQTQWVMKHVYK